MLLFKSSRARPAVIAVAFILVLVQLVNFDGKTLTVSVELGAGTPLESKSGDTETVNGSQGQRKTNVKLTSLTEVKSAIEKSEDVPNKINLPYTPSKDPYNPNPSSKHLPHDRRDQSKTKVNQTNVQSNVEEEVQQQLLSMQSKDQSPPKAKPSKDDNVMSCSTTGQGEICCATWKDFPYEDSAVDDWWLHRPTWETPIQLQNGTHFCFRPIQDASKRKFLNQVHQLQWNNNCSHVLKKSDLNSEYGAATDWLVQSMWHAHENEKRPFQIATNKQPWIYATADTHHWAFCEERDSRCYYLPISPCDRNESTEIASEHDRSQSRTEMKDRLRYQWLREYIFRPRHVFRRQLQLLRQQLQLSQPCSVIHIQRTDNATAQQHTAVKEYVDVAGDAIPKGSAIFLLTDAKSAVEEVNKYLARNYRWIYLNRQRYRGPQGSYSLLGDPGAELLAIETELTLAPTCTNAVVVGRSWFSKHLVEKMDLEGIEYRKFFFDTSVSKHEATKQRTERPVGDMLQEIEAKKQKHDLLNVQQQPVDNKQSTSTESATSNAPSSDMDADLPVPSKEEQEAAKQLVTCTGTASEAQQCCGTWDKDADQWWLHNPDWEVTMENVTHFCFAPFKDASARQVLVRVHDRQWVSGNCSQAEKAVEINSEFSSSIGGLVNIFWDANKRNLPFQIVNSRERWLYASNDTNSWAYCGSEDTRCYFLPVSRCSRQEAIKKEHRIDRPVDRHERHLHYLLKRYLTRPRQRFRQKIFQMRQKLDMSHPCTVVHVERGDVGGATSPSKRYAAVQEYIDVGQVQAGDNIFLVTDDESTIEEIKKHLPSYKWLYFSRQRNRGIVDGVTGHVPSGDHGYEMTVIAAERQLASTCDKLVFGASAFMTSLLDDLDMEGKTYTKHFLDTEVSMRGPRKWSVDYEKFMAEIEEFYHNKARVSKPVVQIESLATEFGTSKRLTEGYNELVHCRKTSGSEECCGTWNVDADEWWLHRPDWFVSKEDANGFCFSPMKEDDRAQFMRNLHERQWVTGSCDDVQRSSMINKGFGSGMAWLAESFWHAVNTHKPFQIAKSDEHWMYAARDKKSWGYCREYDITCYILPISPCSRDDFNEEERRAWEPSGFEEYTWMQQYLFRPKQAFRHKVFEMRQTIDLKYPCTAIHVRRGDVAFPKRPYRKYVGLQEYIHAASVQSGDNVLLLTDDQNTIDEAKKLHPAVNWIYLERPRHVGVSGGYLSYVPSGDGSFELLAIDTELKLAATCNKAVYGDSEFTSAFVQDVKSQRRKVNLYYVNTTAEEEEVLMFYGKPQKRAASLIKAIFSGGKIQTGDLESMMDANLTKPASTFGHTDWPLSCSTTKGGMECCADWSTDVDDWLVHNPTWDVSSETDTKQCFAPMPNKAKAAYYQHLYDNQWKGDCSQLVTAAQINSGYSASINWLANAFLNATLSKRPFQISQHDYAWLYGPQNKLHWAYCESEDITCLTLPISRCKRDFVPLRKLQQHNVSEHFWRDPLGGAKDIDDFEWLKEYMLRPKQIMRRKLFEMKSVIQLREPCLTMHVRRGDAGLPLQPYRRYAAVQEYLDAAEALDGDTILLLTDDQTTIDEIHEYHSNYNWVYLNRTRHSGIGGGLEAYIPSGDGPFEVLTIQLETYLAGFCGKVVQGNSAFMRDIHGKMQAEEKKFKNYWVNTVVSMEEAKQWPGDGKACVAHFMKEMEEYRRKSNAKYKKSRKIEDDGLSKEEQETHNHSLTDETLLISDTEGPLWCYATSQGRECCSSWDINVDAWWLTRPAWAVSTENETTQCFSLIHNPRKRSFFKQIYNNQWKGDCSRVITSTQINSGYSASTHWLGYTFLNATLARRPFQISRHDFAWLYGPQNKSHWAYCESEDIACLTLPLSRCERDFVPKSKLRYHVLNKRYWTTPQRNKDSLEFEWLKEFMLRPTQAFRRKLMEMKLSVNLQLPCTTMHVRRGDAGMPGQPYRRYAAVQEYLDAAEVEEGSNILLLTDDQTTIDEIHKYHTNYNWAYLNRTRHSSVEGGWESHVPSGDGPFEVLAIQAEVYLAGQCSKVVHGNSGFMKVVIGKMAEQGKKYKSYSVDTGVSKEEAAKWPWDGKDRVAHFMKEMEVYREKSKAKRKKALEVDKL